MAQSFPTTTINKTGAVTKLECFCFFSLSGWKPTVLLHVVGRPMCFSWGETPGGVPGKESTMSRNPH